ncbi:MAG: hypothetical protein JXA16_00990 [Bacteroidales bacterium]|nr:hypothetical protein [Bacteroidales bacterium]
MAKEKEKATARILFVEQAKTAKQISKLVNVSEKTISAWVQKHAWKAARNAKAINKDSRIINIKQIIDDFAQNRLELQDELRKLIKSGNERNRIQEIRNEMARIDAGVANWNKTLEQIDKTSKISLSTYLYIMDKIFKSLQNFDAKIFVQSIAFQEHHINEISNELG